MTISTLHDTVVALLATVGVAVFLSIVMIAVGGLCQHDKNRQQASTHSSGPARHVTQDDDPRELVLR
jgi:hypothetical protein